MTECFKGSRDYHDFHDISRTSLFKQSIEAYTATDVDAHFWQPAKRTLLLLKRGDRPLGVATLDRFSEARAAVRAVAIHEDCQGAGHGRVLGRMVEDFARAQGVVLLGVNADPEKTEYYAKIGYCQGEWGSSEIDMLKTLGAHPLPVQMFKKI